MRCGAIGKAAITGFDRPERFEIFSTYPNMGTLSLVFLRNSWIDTSFGKQ
jgi:hypothetical protein